MCLNGGILPLQTYLNNDRNKTYMNEAMTKAKSLLNGKTTCVLADAAGHIIRSERRGIAPMMLLFEQLGDTKLPEGFCAADKIVGKAAAFLFVRAGINSVYAEVLSRDGKAVLDAYGIPVEYETLSDRIINRTGDDICPMEKCVAACKEPEEGYLALRKLCLELGILKTEEEE